MNETMHKIETLQARRRVPRATYRFQFNSGFTFEQARELVDYLADLGISDLYSSPILRALPGSTHGYDICDHGEINPELGGREGFDRLSAALRGRDMGLLLDVVPNHMGIDQNCNAWWLDVLENGPASRYAPYFDIAWHPVKHELENRVLLPVLEDPYGDVLVAGKLALAYENGAFILTYGAMRLPLAPRSYAAILEATAERLRADLAVQNELLSVATAVHHLPQRTETDAEQLETRARELAIIKQRLANVVASSEDVQAALDAALSDLNGVPGEPASFDALEVLLNEQAYRLAFWRVAGEEINYRRFFDINTMAAIRSEREDVFEDTHRLIFELIGAGQVTGLRIDHPDGLWNPAAYFRRLQARYLQAALGTGEALDGWLDEQAQVKEQVAWPLYVVVEKILSEREPLPPEWAVAGTTGYDFMNVVNGIFVDAASERAFDEVYADFIGRHVSFSDLEYAAKKVTMQEALASEINSLAHDLERLAERNRPFRDFTLNGLLFALREILACLSIYRTYLTGPESVSSRDQSFVEQATADAIRRNPRTSRVVFNFVRDTLLLRNLYLFRPQDRDDVQRFALRFQQISGPVMAKSVEDTAFYIYNRLVSLNEVGGSPAQFGLSLDTFHEWNARRIQHWPHAMVSLSTHDTKRGEDVRARLNVLSEVPDEWRAALAIWREINAPHKPMTDDGPAPDANDEYLFYQALLGAWPLDETELDGDGWDTFRQRISGYMAKATHEAKVHTSWTNPNDAYDQAVAAFVAAVLQPENRAFLDAFLPLQRRIAWFGQFNSLGQTLLKLTAPGVPDTYRGTETWDFSLVDPDNRRPVDYGRLRAKLRNLAQCADENRAQMGDDLVQTGADGRIKVYTTHTALAFRGQHETLYCDGDYLPLDVMGDKAGHVCAFARVDGGDCAITVAPRLVAGLVNGVEQAPMGEEVWGDTAIVLPEGFSAIGWRNVFTGEMVAPEAGVIALSAVLKRFPVALLEPVPERNP